MGDGVMSNRSMSEMIREEVAEEQKAKEEADRRAALVAAFSRATPARRGHNVGQLSAAKSRRRRRVKASRASAARNRR